MLHGHYRSLRQWWARFPWITGGMPRVVELFEARKPKDPAGQIQATLCANLERWTHDETDRLAFFQVAGELAGTAASYRQRQRSRASARS